MKAHYTKNHEYFNFAVSVRVKDLIDSGITMTEIKRRFGYGKTLPLHKIVEYAINPFGGWYCKNEAIRMKKLLIYAQQLAD